ncbi:unnamed protein product [Closterium sp. NIES-65]|nr:unnamed protein product [Closterium sp. NIES-65]
MLLHPSLDLHNLHNLSGDSGDLSHLEHSHATHPPHRLLVAQQQPSAAASVATSAFLDDPSPPPPPPAPPPPREVELDSCALQSVLPQLLPPALLDLACFNHLSLHSAHETPADNGGGGGDESSAPPPPETATPRDLLDVARNKVGASTVWAPVDGAADSAEGAGGAGETGGAGGPKGPGRAEPAAASTLTLPNEVITVCRSAAQPASPSVRISVGRRGEAGARRWRGSPTTLASCLPISSPRCWTCSSRCPRESGFNLARYLLGASFNATNSPQLTKDTMHQANLPGYKPSKAAPYVWAADWQQRKVLKGAMQRGVDEVESIAYSAPWWMTISGDTSGNVGGKSNLRPDMYGAFVEYLATLAAHFRHMWSVTFSTMNPVNEPLEGWWSQGGRHEGCSYIAAELDRLCTAVAGALQRKKLSTRVAGFDSFVGFTMRNANLFSGQLLSGLKRILVHGYVPPPPTTTDTREFIEKLYVGLAWMGISVGKEVWVSEIGPMWAGGEDTDVGLFMMRFAIQAINIMGASAWIYWQAINPYLPNNPNSAKWGLFTITHNNVSDPAIVPVEITFSKKFHMMKQMARASPKGSMPLRIETTNGCHHCVASFFNPDKNFISIYIVNQDGDDYSITFKFELFGLMDGSRPYVVEVQRTSASEDAEVVATKSYDDMPQSLAVTAKGRSITTKMISNVVWL